MFDDAVTVFLPISQATVLRLIAVPVCRTHGYDDVLPDAAEQLVQYTLLRPSGHIHGDAVDGFAGAYQHHGLVIRGSVPITQELQYRQAAACNRFPWHPWCQRFTCRGCRVSKDVLQEAAARRQRKQQHQQHAQDSQTGSCLHVDLLQQQQDQQLFPVQLVPVALHAEPSFLQDLAAAIIHHNESVLQQEQQGIGQQQLSTPGSPHYHRPAVKQRPIPAVVLTPLLEQTVVSTAAAVLIQSSWRAHYARLVSCVAEKALLTRIARVIQRAWRAFLLRQRLKLLSGVAAAHKSAQQLRYSSMLCVSVASRRLLTLAADKARAAAAATTASASAGSCGGLFPEHRLRFVFDSQGSLLLVDMSSSTSASSTDNNSSSAHNTAAPQHVSQNPDSKGTSMTAGTPAAPTVNRVGLPTWLGINIPVITAAAAAKILEDQLWFEPFGRADVAKLLEMGCDVKDLIPPEVVADVNACHPADIAQLITFKDKQHAAAAAALLAALTYDVGSQSACALTSIVDTPLGAAYRSAAGGAYCSNAGGAAAVAATSWSGSSSGSGGNNVIVTCSEPAVGSFQGVSISMSGEAPAAAKVTTSLTGSSNRSSNGGHRFINVPLVAVQPTETLTACTIAADDENAASEAVSDSRAAAGLQFYTHLYSRLPYMQHIHADAAQLDAVATTAAKVVAVGAAAAQGAAGNSTADQEKTQAVVTAAAAAAETPADESPGIVVNPAAVLSVRDKAAYHQHIKLQQAGALRTLMATETAAAAASKAAEMDAKKQPMVAARAAAAAADKDSTETDKKSSADASCKAKQQQQQQQLDTMNCSNPGYWPSKTSAAAAATLAMKQQQQAAAAAVVAAVRQEVQTGRQVVLQKVQSDTAALQTRCKLETQVLQQQMLQQEQQQQVAATTRATLLRAVRQVKAAGRQQQQQLAGAFEQRCNTFSKHLKRGEIAVMRAAQQQQADARVTQQRLMNDEAAELTKKKQQEMLDNLNLMNLQDKQQMDSMLLATKSVAATEQAARRAKVVAAVLQEQAVLRSVGPSGGVWGSASVCEVLREPLKMSKIGTVVMGPQ